MTNLTDSDMAELAELGEKIQLDLSCDVNGEGVPCRTDRLEAVKNMAEYLRLHDYTITNDGDM